MLLKHILKSRTQDVKLFNFILLIPGHSEINLKRALFQICRPVSMELTSLNFVAEGQLNIL